MSARLCTTPGTTSAEFPDTNKSCDNRFMISAKASVTHAPHAAPHLTYQHASEKMQHHAPPPKQQTHNTTKRQRAREGAQHTEATPEDTKPIRMQINQRIYGCASNQDKRPQVSARAAESGKPRITAYSAWIRA